MAEFWKKDENGNYIYVGDSSKGEKWYPSKVLQEMPLECTHVTITAEEYTAFMEIQDSLEDFGWDMHRVLDKITENSYKIRNELKSQELLNRNLKRIAVERANAQRGIPNKKTNSGYIVLRSENFKRYVQNIYKKKEYLSVWKTVVQTPYDASIPYKAVSSEINKDMSDIKRLLGLKSIDKEDDIFEHLKENVAFDAITKANYEKGFWELEIHHSRSVTVPPEMLKPRKKR